MIYLDNAATTMQKPPCVIDAVTEALTSLGNASRGAHDGVLRSNRLIYKARKKLSTFFGCPKSEQVIFTNNSTEALNIAINGTINKGDHVITTVLEHNSVLRPLYRLREKLGIQLSFVNADSNGCIDYAEFEQLIQPNTKAIICTHASNLTGNLLDIDQIGRISEEYGLLLIIDASQTAGIVPIDMVKLGISILCFTGHKSMMGPQGTGGLCINGDIEIEPIKVGGTGVQSYLTRQPREYPIRLEAGTLNGHGIAGLLSAVDFISESGIEKIYSHDIELTKRFFEAVTRIPEIKIYGDFSSWNRCPIVALNVSNIDSSEVSDELLLSYGIATRPGAHCAPLMHDALGTKTQGAVRFSFGYYNTIEDIDTAVKAIRQIASR